MTIKSNRKKQNSKIIDKQSSHIENRRPFGADINPIGADGGRFLLYTEIGKREGVYF